MKYIQLKKLFHTNEKECNELYLSRFNGETTKKLTEIPSYILESLSTSVKVDITPKGAFDKYAQELSLENMFTQGKITFEE